MLYPPVAEVAAHSWVIPASGDVHRVLGIGSGLMLSGTCVNGSVYDQRLVPRDLRLDSVVPVERAIGQPRTSCCGQLLTDVDPVLMPIHQADVRQMPFTWLPVAGSAVVEVGLHQRCKNVELRLSVVADAKLPEIVPSNGSDEGINPPEPFQRSVGMLLMHPFLTPFSNIPSTGIRQQFPLTCPTYFQVGWSDDVGLHPFLIHSKLRNEDFFTQQCDRGNSTGRTRIPTEISVGHEFRMNCPPIPTVISRNPGAIRVYTVCYDFYHYHSKLHSFSLSASAIAREKRLCLANCFAVKSFSIQIHLPLRERDAVARGASP